MYEGTDNDANIAEVQIDSVVVAVLGIIYS